MELIKKFFSDKGRVGVAIVCLLMMSVLVVSAMTGESFASITYTATFYVDGSKYNIADCSIASTDELFCRVTLPSVSKTGYTFNGWSTSSSSCSNVVTGSAPIGQDTNFYACFTIAPKTYTAKFYVDGALYKTDDCTTEPEVATCSVTFPSASKTGHTFDGWSTSSSNCNSVVSAGNRKIKYSDNYYACFTPNTYTIEYVSNAGGDDVSDVPASQKKSYGVPIKLSDKIPQRSGYEFLGWGTSATTSEVAYEAGADYTDNADEYLYAIWKEATPVTYSVSYNSNNGTGTMSNSTYTKGVSQALRKNTFTRTGYTFNGWNTKADGTGNKYTDGQSISISSDLTLYAQWKINKVNIKYNTNGGTIKEANGYSAKDGIIYSGNEFFIHTINYGTTTSSDGLSDYNNPDFINITRNGYSVPIDAEWICLSGDCTVGKTYDQSKQYNHSDFCDASKSNCNVVLGVNWKANKVNIKYNTNGGTIKEANGYSAKDGIIYNGNDVFIHTIDYGKSTSSDGLSDYNNPNFINIARNGYSALTGAEWVCLSGGCTTGKTFSQSKQYNHSDFCDASKGDCNVVLGVNWQVNKYTVKYNANGGAGTMQDSTYTYGVSKMLTANSFTRTDYTFKCWNTKADGSGVNYTDKQNIKITENLTLYAQWKANDSASGEEETVIKYYIRYDKNGGVGTMENSEHTYGYASNLSKNTFTRTGYAFDGWNTKADGTGTTYTDGETISNLASTNGEVVTLYAQWLEKVNDDDDGNPSIPGTDNDNSGNDSNQENDNLDNGPVTGSLATILVSLIGIGALGGTIYYRKKIKN